MTDQTIPAAATTEAGREHPAPLNLRTNGQVDPLGVGDSMPVLTWTPAGGQVAVQVETIDSNGAPVRDSGVVWTSAREMKYRGPSASRGQYRWRVRVLNQDACWSEWSPYAWFEFGLLAEDDWKAAWVARPVPAVCRPTRSIESDHVAWIGAGEHLGQSFVITGPVTSVQADLVAQLGDRDVQARLELINQEGEIVAGTGFDGVAFVWDRFSRFFEVSPPAPAGTYTVRLTSVRGRVGWRTATSLPHSGADDDGVSSLPVNGIATRNGTPEPGVRAIGVEALTAPNPVLRKTIHVPSLGAARLHGVGLGYGIFRVNGVRVGDEILEPAPTAYNRTVLVRTWDISRLLRVGENEITVELGRGFYSARGASNWGWNLAKWNREPAARAQVELDTGDGYAVIVKTDESWSTRASDVVAEVLYAGEHQSPPTAGPWEPAAIVPGPDGRMTPATIPAIRKITELSAVGKLSFPGGATFDFGETTTGGVRIVVQGAPGDRITIRYGELLDAEGRAWCENELVAGRPQVDTYTISDAGESVYEPRFVYRGFRYVTVETSGTAQARNVTAYSAHTDVPSTGEARCSEPALDFLMHATERTFLNNLQGIPTDTPVYEKNGWTADAHLAAESVLHFRDLRTTLMKWLDDHVDAQDRDGVIPQIVPTPGWGADPDPAWSSSLALIAWDLYTEYGDPDILARYHEPIRSYTDRMLTLAPDGLWPLHSWGDWLAPGHVFAPEGPAPTATMMLHRLATVTAQISEVLGASADAERYRRAAEKIANAYHRAFFDAEANLYGVPDVGYRQAMNILPLAFGITPPAVRAEVAANLIQDIESRAGGTLDCGAIALKYLFPLLSDLGRTDLAITVATKPEGPSWERWRAAGETTLLESWDDDVRSHNHYFLGAATAWVLQRVLGVRATAPGWRSFDVAPVDDPRVPWGSFAHHTQWGTITAEWQRFERTIRCSVTAPAGTDGTLTFDGGSRAIGPGTTVVDLELPTSRPGPPTRRDDWQQKECDMTDNRERMT